MHPDDDDPEIAVDLFVYDDSDTPEQYCERVGLIEEYCETQDRLFGTMTVGKA